MRRFHSKIHWFLMGDRWCFEVERPDVFENGGPRMAVFLRHNPSEPGSFLVESVDRCSGATTINLFRPIPRYYDEMDSSTGWIAHGVFARHIFSPTKQAVVTVEFPLYDLWGLKSVTFDLYAWEDE